MHEFYTILIINLSNVKLRSFVLCDPKNFPLTTTFLLSYLIGHISYLNNGF
jgi:hypothetical protein